MLVLGILGLIVLIINSGLLAINIQQGNPVSLVFLNMFGIACAGYVVFVGFTA